MNTRSINRKMRYLGTLAVFLGLGVIANTASADIRLAKQNTAPQGNTISAYLDLDGTASGIQSVVNFKTSNPNRLVRVIFNAEGSIAGGPSNWLDTTILINPAGVAGEVACAPSNSDNAFVSGNGTATQNDGWVSAVTQCFYRIPSIGDHTVRVLVSPRPGGTPWRIDDLSLVIDDD